MKKLILDLDDVLCDFVSSWCNWLHYEKKWTETLLTPRDIKTYDHFLLNYGSQSHDFFAKDPHSTYTDWVEPLEGSHEFVEWCHNNFDEVQILTHATIIDSQKAKRAFVSKHFNIKNIKYSSSKMEKYNYTNGAILVDDYPLNVLKHIQFNEEHGICFNKDRMNAWSTINCHPEFINNPDINLNKYWEVNSYEQLKQILTLIKEK